MQCPKCGAEVDALEHAQEQGYVKLPSLETMEQHYTEPSRDKPRAFVLGLVVWLTESNSIGLIDFTALEVNHG